MRHLKISLGPQTQFLKKQTSCILARKNLFALKALSKLISIKRCCKSKQIYTPPMNNSSISLHRFPLNTDFIPFTLDLTKIETPLQNLSSKGNCRTYSILSI